VDTAGSYSSYPQLFGAAALLRMTWFLECPNSSEPERLKDLQQGKRYPLKQVISCCLINKDFRYKVIWLRPWLLCAEAVRGKGHFRKIGSSVLSLAIVFSTLALKWRPFAYSRNEPQIKQIGTDFRGRSNYKERIRVDRSATT
jgi:hypothetical protein